MMTPLKIVSIILFSLLWRFLYADEPSSIENPPLAQQIISPSPTAASLGQFGSIPVGLFTGTPNVSIPLYELKSSSLSVPISLSYGSNGIKVNEISTWVGLGWNLNAGGVISRTVMDEPDESSNWFLIDDLHTYTAELHSFVQSATDEGNDGQPDIFYYSFQGRSGRFVIDQSTRTAKTIPYENLKIDLNFDDELGSIVITDEQGIKYYFGDQAIEYSKAVNSISVPGPHNPIATAWYLTKIEHPLGDYILFNYVTNNYNYKSNISQTYKALKSSDACGGGPYCTSGIQQTFLYTTQYIYGKTLTSIETRSSGKVVFAKSNNRSDLSSADRIDSMKVINPANQLIKGYKFFQSFIYSSGTLPSGLPTDATLRYRMYLDSIHVYGNDLVDRIPYAFSYNSRLLPPRFSFAQDHWGYYNGATSNSYLVPSLEVAQGFFGNIGGNRNPNSTYSGYGLLNKVTYPTKGFSELSYESNSYRGTLVTYPTKTSFYMEAETDEETFIYTKNQVLSTVGCDQEDVELALCVDSLPGCLFKDKIKANIKIKNLSTNDYIDIKEFSSITGLHIDNYTSLLFDSATLSTHNYKIDLEQGVSYQFEIMLVKPLLKAEVYFEYYNSSPTYTQTNLATGGVRVSQTIDNDGSNSIIKKYYYNDYAHRTESSGTTPNLPIYLSYGENHQPCALPLSETICEYAYLNSSSQNPLANTGSNIIYYPKVTVSFGESFEGGGIEHYFTILEDTPSDPKWGKNVIGAPYTNTGWKNGIPIQENYFKISGGSKVNTKTVTYSYSEDASKHFEQRGAVVIKKFDYSYSGPYQMVLTQENIDRYYIVGTEDHDHSWVVPVVLSDPLLWVLNDIRCLKNDEIRYYPWAGFNVGDTVKGLNRPDNYDIAEYKVISGFNKLDAITTTEDGVTTVINNYYKSPYHSLITKSITNDSKGNQIISKYSYSPDYIVNDGDECHYNKLVCQNISQDTLYECLSGCYEYDKESEEFMDCKTNCLSIRNASLLLCEEEFENCIEELSTNNHVQAIGTMQERHVISPALEVRQYRGSDMIGGSFTEPMLLDGKSFPGSYYKFESSVPITTNDSSYISNNNILNILPSFRAQLHYDKFDDSGNILQYHTNGNNVTSILWGYGNSFPVVKIDGIAYDQISSGTRTAILNHSYTMDANFESVEQDVEFLKTQLASISSDSKYSVSFYTYSPQIGRTSETNCNGITTYYEYDDLGRLTIVRNDEGMIIKQITYNYIQ